VGELPDAMASLKTRRRRSSTKAATAALGSGARRAAAELLAPPLRTSTTHHGPPTRSGLGSAIPRPRASVEGDDSQLDTSS
jgi:hypothetical protein